MRDCLTETEVLEFLDGRLSSAAMEALEHHVDTCRRCRDLVCYVARPSSSALGYLSTPGVSRSRADGPTFAQGDLVAGRHRIVRFIAAGGMGEVYEAEDTLLNERVALKTVGAALSDHLELADRLKREVLLARKVTHANVCRIFDVGLHPRGEESIIFMTMELVAGDTLGRQLRSGGAMSTRDALPLIAQIAAALDAAHQAGIIHRDLKSDNVLLRGGRAVVTDFGLAQAHATREARDQRLIRLDALSAAGTPHYMAPEQVLGEPVTAAADIYALGVVIYEMVTGKLPFSSGSTPFAVTAKRRSYQPISPATHVPDLPARWTRAILRCLDRDPDRRFAHAGDVVAALSPRRGRWVALAGIAGVLATAGVTAASLRAGSHTLPACPALDLASGHVHVDAHVKRAGTGAEACPFATISEALAATEKAAGHHTIHVAAGTYDTALGERFPLVVRGDLSLEGAGASLTSIVGVGPYDSLARGGNVGPLKVTLVTGDPSTTTEIKGLAFAPGERQADQSFGVLCDSGNDSVLDTGVERPASTRITDSSLGPDYGWAVVASQSTGKGGCNLAVVRDEFHRDRTGLWLVGCGAVDTPNQAVSAVVEDSVFSGMHASEEPGGAGIVAWDCTDYLRVKSSRFMNGDNGILMVSHGPRRHGLVVENGDFSTLSRSGIDVGRQAYIERLTGTAFVANTAGPVVIPGRRSVGLRLDSSIAEGMTPEVKLARDNIFTGNDIGIEILGHAALTGTFDFGRPDDPGKNVVRCNGTIDGSSVTGHDLIIEAPLGASTRLLFAGNVWDHWPPTEGETPNGADILAPAGSIDTSGGSASVNGCANGLP